MIDITRLKPNLTKLSVSEEHIIPENLFYQNGS
jgi:hypothetical protein